MCRVISVIAVGLVGVIAGPAFAHHSYGMFDRVTQKTLAGTVTEFQWTNPHCHLLLRVAANGNEKDSAVWDIEIGPPVQLARDGWKRLSVMPGDKVTAVIAPLRDGTPGGHLLLLTKPDGQVLQETNKTLRGEGGDKQAPTRTPDP